jgi:SAM-dependent methyltransferase
MQLVPGARRQEFALALDGVELKPTAVLCDIPSGGGYLFDHLPSNFDIRLVAVDPSEVFARTWSNERIEWHLGPLDRLPLADNTADSLVSIAGLHHVEDRRSVFSEMRRVLRHGGALCILDVPVGATTDRFLNDFVHRHNSMGHEGRFVDDDFRMDLAATGFHIKSDELCRYAWEFSSEAEMIEFIRLMFWLDKASPATISEGLKEFLGVVVDDRCCKMSWELQRIVVI